MKKIASIPTHSFEPISFGGSYLYTHYEKLRSFLQVNFNQNVASFIAKPVINNSEVSWYANYYTDFKPISQFDDATQGTILSNYWDVITSVTSKINTLRSRSKSDQNEWYSLLSSVFDSENNKIYSDGENVVVLWGWKFFNAHENKLPTFIPHQKLSNLTNNEEQLFIDQDQIISNYSDEVPVNENVIEEQKEEPLIQEQLIDIEDQVVEEEPEIVIPEEKKSFWSRFLEFLKWFASKYWWLLLVLLLIILFLLLVNSCENDRIHSSRKEIEDINNRIEYLRNKTNECCGCELNKNEQ